MLSPFSLSVKGVKAGHQLVGGRGEERVHLVEHNRVHHHREVFGEIKGADVLQDRGLGQGVLVSQNFLCCCRRENEQGGSGKSEEKTELVRTVVVC